jgi:hypothetical protein
MFIVPGQCGTVTVDATATGKTLATLGVTLTLGLMRLTLIPKAGAGTVNFAFGSASATTFELPASGIQMQLTNAQALTLKLFAAGGSSAVDVYASSV